MSVVAPLDSKWAGPGTLKGCGTCKHIHAHTLFSTCDAFPSGIPGLFINGEVLHNKPFEGDQGIQYEGIPFPTIDELIAELEEREARGEA
jgi:hypothetical protein